MPKKIDLLAEFQKFFDEIESPKNRNINPDKKNKLYHNFLKKLRKETGDNSLDPINLPLDNNGNTALIYSILRNNLRSLKILINNGAQVNKGNYNEDYPLMIASSLGNTDLLETLRKNGAEIEKKNKDGLTAFMSAAANDKIESMRVLQQGEIKQEEKNDALYYAAKFNKENSFSFLMLNGAKLTDKTSEIITENKNKNPEKFISLRDQALSLFTTENNDNIDKKIIDLLLDDEAINSCHNEIKLAFLSATIDNNNLKSLDYLIDKFGVNIQDPNKATSLLIMAAESGNEEAVKTILKHNPEIDSTNKNGNTALMFAASGNHLNIMEELLKAGASTDITDNKGFSAINFTQDDEAKKLVLKYQNNHQNPSVKITNSKSEKLSNEEELGAFSGCSIQ